MKCVACHSEASIKISVINKFDVYKCRNCGLIYTSPLPDDEVLNSFYQGFLFEKPQLSDIKNQIPKKKKELKRIFDFSSFDLSQKNFLDFGGGTGLSWIAAKEIGLDAYYFDIDKQAKEFVVSNFGLDELHSIDNPNESEKKFDYILSDNVIEHLKNPVDFVQNLYNILNPGGQIVIKTPRASNCESFFIFSVWFLVYFKKAVKENGLLNGLKSTFVHRYWHCEPPRHLYGFSDLSFKKMFEKTIANEARVSVSSYILPAFKFSIGDVLLHVKNPILRYVLLLIFLPVIILELPVIGLRYLLISLKLISLSGMIVKIEKPI